MKKFIIVPINEKRPIAIIDDIPWVRKSMFDLYGVLLSNEDEEDYCIWKSIILDYDEELFQLLLSIEKRESALKLVEKIDVKERLYNEQQLREEYGRIIKEGQASKLMGWKFSDDKQHNNGKDPR